MSIKLENLRYFCGVAEAGNLADAAERLGRTQSALSTSLKQLEAHFGSKLFDGERKSQLSPFGEEVFALARSQIRQFDQSVKSMEISATATNGLVRIASVPSVAAIVFPTVLNKFNAQFPEVKVELRDTDSQQVLDALANGKADIGIASGHHAINGVTATRLFEDRFGLVGATNHPLLKRRKSPTIDEVVNRYFVRNALCDLINTPKFMAALNSVVVTVPNNLSLINIICTGNWVSVLPEAVGKSLPDNVAFRLLPDLPDTREVWLYHREKSRFNDLIESSCEMIKSVNMD